VLFNTPKAVSMAGFPLDLQTSPTLQDGWCCIVKQLHKLNSRENGLICRRARSYEG